MVRLPAPSARIVRPTSRHAVAAVTSARHASSVDPPTTPSAAAVAPATPASLRSLLQETTSALAQVDRLTKGGEGEGVWSRRLDRALARLAKDERRQLAGTAGVHGSREITLYGTSLTGSDDLLLALLEDPLAGEEEGSVLQRESLLELIDRSKGSDIVSISFGQGLSGKVEGASDDQVLQETRLESTAPFLQVSPDIKLSFIPSSTAPDRALAQLLLSPTPTLIIDSLRLFSPYTSTDSTHPSSSASKTSSSLLGSVLRHPGLKIVVNRVGGRGPVTANKADGRLWTEIGHLVGFDPRIVDSLRSRVTWVDVQLAAEGFDAWRKSAVAGGEDERVKTLKTFTDNVVGSNVESFKNSLVRPSSSTTATTIPVPFLLDLALDSAQFDLLAYDSALQSHSLATKALTNSSAHLATQFFTKALVVPPKVGAIPEEGNTEGRVSEEVVKDVSGAVRSVLGRFGWLGLVGGGRVDDLAQEVGESVRLSWGGEGEKILVYQTGILSVLQQSLAASLQRTLSSPAHPSLHSAVLINDLPRLNPIHPTLLLAPLQGRLDQLLSSSGPISVLQLRAQNAARSTYALSAGSVASGYGAWLVDVLGAESGLGLAALGTAIGLRWGMGKWEKAKRKFWVDFARVESGLEEDLQKNTHQVVSDVLLARPRKAVEGMEAMVVKRRAELETTVGEVERLRRALEGVKFKEGEI